MRGVPGRIEEEFVFEIQSPKQGLSSSAVKPDPSAPTGNLEGTGPDAIYRIEQVQSMRPFLASIVSDADLWMYVSSTGGLTAGRRNEDGAIFPYVTDDLLHESAGLTGPLSVIRIIQNDGSAQLWRPFATGAVPHGVTRSLGKSVAGDRIEFIEINASLGLKFSYTWRACDRFGWVRSCAIASTHGMTQRVQILDGLRNILPASAQLATVRAASCLINAYSTAELDEATGMLLVALSSQIVDRPEPSESLHANVIWHQGLHPRAILISNDQIETFAATGQATTENVLRGRRASYFIIADADVSPNTPASWRIIADARRTQAQIVALRSSLLQANSSQSHVHQQIEPCLDDASQRLHRFIASADASQSTGRPIVAAHHFSNTLFNSFRGGAVLEDGAIVPTHDFLRFLRDRNRPVAHRTSQITANWPTSMPHRDLIRHAESCGDVDLIRLAHEYLPLAFGRRHGDPSRPWNRFDIVTAHPDGTPALSYEGNWRDIFQNWEALALSHADLLEPIIAKFVNASTPDGFNPYRITRAGIDWEVPEPHNPWSHIGYWGDHQIAYLLRLLELSHARRPGLLEEWLDRAAFSYADVPYRIRSHEQVCRDPKHTIDFDFQAHRASMQAVDRIGSDGRLVRDSHDRVVHVTFAEKLLVPALSKLSSFIPGAGIWMNTQRPEWNDANNALVGYGVSMVTLAYLRRYLAFVLSIIANRNTIRMRPIVQAWLADIAAALEQADARRSATDTHARRALLDRLGKAFESYSRAVVSADHESSTAFQNVEATLDAENVRSLIHHALRHLDETIAVNRRDDGLFHSYNLIILSEQSASVERLDAMLEGQVAILSSGLLSPDASADLVEAMFRSPLYRQDQRTFMLYPRREPKPFLEKAKLHRVDPPILQEMLQRGDERIILRDSAGEVRFHPNLKNDRDLIACLESIASSNDPIAPRIRAERDAILAAHEEVFNMRAFTGRSGSMFGYEGIGCVYWHMVAKLLLAVGECFDRATPGTNARRRLGDLYYRVRSGLGFNKSPDEYGAFPLDAYSHTPLHAGAQQPGMTGQVKEEFLTRMLELGVRLAEGRLSFDPSLLQVDEFLQQPGEYSPRCNGRNIRLDAGTLGFTLAGVPVIYRLADAQTSSGSSIASVEVYPTGESRGPKRFHGTSLDQATTQRLFARDGSIDRIHVTIPRDMVRAGDV